MNFFLILYGLYLHITNSVSAVLPFHRVCLHTAHYTARPRLCKQAEAWAATYFRVRST